ncbi:MAG: hypothetical protein FE78DRAFT_40726 [Acidomyces sp. 'richmondensis']|nr:MAG: hypothetical protein FE78DRAFT_40726 [Acidomyces sp. 'richmondensis']
MADIGKDDLYEMRRRPVDGEHSQKSNIDENVGWAIEPGNEKDEVDMRRMGHKQQLSRSFRSLSILGLTTIVTNTWLAWLSSSTFALYDGGRGEALYSYIDSWFLSLLIVLSLAEMASMAPTSGGQYHWVSEFAPPTVKKPLSYLSGWLAGLGWHALIAAASYASGNLILILAQTVHPSYIPTAWQGTLMTILTAVSATLFVAFAAKALPIF